MLVASDRVVFRIMASGGFKGLRGTYLCVVLDARLDDGVDGEFSFLVHRVGCMRKFLVAILCAMSAVRVVGAKSRYYRRSVILAELCRCGIGTWADWSVQLQMLFVVVIIAGGDC